MDARDSRDLDGVIDDVARAMTGTELARDLRSPVAARIATRSSWTFGWRWATAAAVMVVVGLVALMRTAEYRPSVQVADSGPARPAVAPPVARATVEAPVTTITRAAVVQQRVRRAVSRQTLAPVTSGIVEIDPLEIVPLEDEDAATRAQRAQVVAIAPIEVEPVRIGQLELVE